MNKPFQGLLENPHVLSDAEFFVILVNCFRSFHNLTRNLVFVIVRVLDLSMHFIIIVIIIAITIRNIISVTFLLLGF